MLLNKILRIAARAAEAVARVAGAVCRRFAKSRKTEERNREVLLAGLFHHASLYDGLYEGIYLAAHQKTQANRDAIREFCGRTAHLEEDTAFSQTFVARFGDSEEATPEEYQAKMGELLALIQAAGIVRATDQELALSPQIRKEYIFLGDPVPSDGVVCLVMKPSWFCQGRLVEQGILMAKEGLQ